MHYAIRLPDLACDYFKLTPIKGALTGESFKQYPVHKGDCIIGDRAYSTVQGIAYLARQETYSLVRVNTSALPFFCSSSQDSQAEPFDLLSHLSLVQEDYEMREYRVQLKTEEEEWIYGRLCVMRKSQTAIELAQKQIKLQAYKHRNITKPSTLEYAKYIILFTTLPKKQMAVHEHGSMESSLSDCS